MTTSYAVESMSPAAIDRARRTRLDTSGNPVVALTAEGGEPLRCCLRDAVAGEDCLLFGYEPPLPPSPYRELTAVFTHAALCDGPTGTDYPTGFLGRPQVLRAYDGRGWIHPATVVHDGTDPEPVIASVFEHPDVVQILSHNVAYGCYMFTVRRSQ